MDKIKSVFSPGSKADDDVLYGDGNNSNLSNVAGQGSHFGHSRTTDPVEGGSTGATNAPAGRTGIGSSNMGTSSAGTGATSLGSNTQTSPSDALRAAQVATKPQAHDYQQTASSIRQDPRGTTSGLAASRANAPLTQQNMPDRTAGTTGGAANQAPIHNEFGSTFDQSQGTAGTGSSLGARNPYSSRSIDPRIDPTASSAKQDHDIGRDAALGTAATGTAYKGDRLHREHQQTQQPTGQSSHHLGRDAALGTAAAGTAYEGDRLHREHQQTQPTQSTQQPTTQSSHHLGRDAALGTAAAGTAHEGDRLHREHQQTQQTASQSGRVGAAAHAAHANKANPNEHTQAPPGAMDAGDSEGVHIDRWVGPEPQGTTGSSNDPSTGHHHGRDAALGAGAGAVGIGGYEAAKHHDGAAQPQTSNTQGLSASTVIEPRSTAPANRNTQQQPTIGGGYYTQPQETAVGSQQPGGHHYGRDAALGAGAGAVGLGGYEAAKHHEASAHPQAGTMASQAQPPSAQTSAPGQTTSTDTRHPTQTMQERHPEQYHYGRDAALGASAVGVGGAAYEAQKHEDKNRAQEQQRQAEKEHDKTLKEHEKEIRKEEKQHDKALKEHEKEIHKQEKQHDKEIKREEKQHEKDLKAAHAEQEKHFKEEERRRREKEAVGAAGVGAAGVVVGEHEHDRNKDDDGEGKKKGGLLSRILHPGRKDDDVDDQGSGEHKDHHRGKEAAAGAGTVGAAALGKHEYDEHRHPNATDTTYGHTHPQAAGTTYGQSARDSGAVPITSATTQSPSATHGHHHRGEEAMAGAGALGAAGLGKHEYDRHHQTPQDMTQTQTGYGQPSRGITGQSPQAHDSRDPSRHHGRDAAIGAGAVGAGALGKHEYDQRHQGPQDTTGSQFASGQGSQPYGNVPTQSAIGQPTQASDNRDRSHYYGRDAAAGAGVLGAGALGKHEYGQHHQGSQDPSGPQTGTLGGQPSQANDNRDKPHHYGRDAAAGAGVLGAGAIGTHEYDKHRHTVQDPSQTQATMAGQPAQQTTLANEPHQTHHHHHHKEEAAAGAGAAGAGAKHGHDKHHAVLGGFHGKEGGAPGAVGVAPEDRDQRYAESQRHPEHEGEHKKHGLLGGIFSSHKDDKNIDVGTGHSDRNRLHKV